MPSLYTPSGVELIGNGEQSGSWNDTTNTNLQILDRMISQAVEISLSGTTHTLTLSDGVLSDGQYAVLVFGGSPSGTNTVTISPNDARRTYIVKNDSGETVVLTQGSGGNVSVETGKGAIVYCDGAGSGAEVVDLTATFVPSLASLGITATAAEINILDGVTATTAELNILDGVTATTAELNILDGVTATTAELNILDGVTATTAELNTLDGITATTAELNKLDGVSGAVVGTTDTQALSNKTLTAPTINTSVTGTAIASQAEAEAGTATNKVMTPQRTAQAIAAQVSTSIPDGSVTTSKIANLNVTEGKLATGSVTNAKLGASSVSSAKLSVGTRSFSGTLGGGNSTTVAFTDNYAFAPRLTSGTMSASFRTNAIQITNDGGDNSGYSINWRYMA